MKRAPPMATLVADDRKMSGLHPLPTFTPSTSIEVPVTEKMPLEIETELDSTYRLQPVSTDVVCSRREVLESERMLPLETVPEKANI